jgi:hypothetical protein
VYSHRKLTLFQNATIRNFATESLTAIIHNSLAHTISNPLSTSQEPIQETETSENTQLTDDSTSSHATEAGSTTEPQQQQQTDIKPSKQNQRNQTNNNKQQTDIKPYPPQTLDGRTLSMQELHVDAMQVKMLEALTELSKNSHNDVKDKTLNAVDTLLQSSGQTLNSGYIAFNFIYLFIFLCLIIIYYLLFHFFLYYFTNIYLKKRSRSWVAIGYIRKIQIILAKLVEVQD